jgi:hypothetical protein
MASNIDKHEAAGLKKVIDNFREESPEQLTVAELMKFRNFNKIKPVDGCQNIPGINIPTHLTQKNGLELTLQTIQERIRPLFNFLDMTNIPETVDRLYKIIETEIKDITELVLVAKEFMSNFLVSEQNIEMYLSLLNRIYFVGIRIGSEKESEPLGYYFIAECQNTFKMLFSSEHVEKLSKLDIHNLDAKMEYENGNKRMINLMILFCNLYRQRESNNIKLRANQLIFITDSMINSYITYRQKMLLSIDNYTDEIIDEKAYEQNRIIMKLYAGSLYNLLKYQGDDLYRDPAANKMKLTMKILIDKFMSVIIPTLIEPKLRALCAEFNFGK